MDAKLFRRRINLNINQIIALAFLGIIAMGTLLLALPFATRSQGSCGLLTALFTATSAVCVTGLSLVDIWSTYNFFGQFVILLLMETGGLGFMSIVSILFYVTNHHDNVQSLSIIAESLGSDGLKHIGRIQKRLLLGSALFEGIGALVLFIAFIPYFGVGTALWYGIFHAVSAFCNAGFDLMGILEPGSSLTLLQNNPTVLITIALLIIIGGIGFVVWDDIATSKRIRNWSVYTKLVIITTIGLLLVGAVLFFLFESDRTDSFGSMSVGNQLVNAFFQSASTRTAGFAAVSQDQFSDTSIVLTIFLMMIGGSTGSTAGGIKTVTFLVLLITVLNSIIGRKQIVIFNRTITAEKIAQAYTVVGSFILLGFIGGIIINTTSDVSFTQAIFESISALATVGLSLGITDSISMISKIILILYMYIGRVGLLTLTLGFFKAKENYEIKYPSAKIMIG